MHNHRHQFCHVNEEHIATDNTVNIFMHNIYLQTKLLTCQCITPKDNTVNISIDISHLTTDNVVNISIDISHLTTDNVVNIYIAHIY